MFCTTLRARSIQVLSSSSHSALKLMQPWPSEPCCCRAYPKALYNVGSDLILQASACWLSAGWRVFEKTDFRAPFQCLLKCGRLTPRAWTPSFSAATLNRLLKDALAFVPKPEILKVSRALWPFEGANRATLLVFVGTGEPGEMATCLHNGVAWKTV